MSVQKKEEDLSNFYVTELGSNNIKCYTYLKEQLEKDGIRVYTNTPNGMKLGNYYGKGCITQNKDIPKDKLDQIAVAFRKTLKKENSKTITYLTFKSSYDSKEDRFTHRSCLADLIPIVE